MCNFINIIFSCKVANSISKQMDKKDFWAWEGLSVNIEIPTIERKFFLCFNQIDPFVKLFSPKMSSTMFQRLLMFAVHLFVVRKSTLCKIAYSRDATVSQCKKTKTCLELIFLTIPIFFYPSFGYLFELYPILSNTWYEFVFSLLTLNRGGNKIN